MNALAPADMMASAQPVAPPPMPAPVTHDVTLVTTKKLSQAKVLGVPPEEFGIERGARDIKTCNYCFHEVVTKTEGELIAEGFDATQVKALSDYRANTNQEEWARDSVRENSGNSSTNTSARLVKITEHYVRMDYEGKGRPCLYQVITGGDDGDILMRDGKDCIEPYDTIPFATTTPVPVTHRFFGRSLADLVMDVQRIKTALLRGTLDNSYMVTNPRIEIAESHAGVNTIDDLLVSRPNGVVRTKQPGGLQSIQTPPIGQYLMPVMEYMDGVREMRTGVTRQSQGVDANALQNQSATAVAQTFSASQARMKLIARIMAEGVRDIFSLLHGTIRKHGQEKQTVRLRNTWVDVNPRDWKTRNDMTINVGLGTGGKGERVAHLMALANFQKELLLGGKTNLVDDQALYNTFKQLAKLMDYKNPDQFINDPSAKNPQTGEPLHPPPPPQPSPEEVKGKVQLTIAQQQAQLDEKADQRKAGIEQVQAQADIATQDRKTNAEMIQSQQDFEFKKQLAIMEFEMQRELKMAELEMKREMHQQGLDQRAEQHRQQLEAGVFKSVQGQEAHEQRMEQVTNKPETAGD